MILGVLKEINDRRVAIAPETLPKLEELGCEVWIESGAGENSYYQDDDYSGNAKITSRNEILSSADLLLTIFPVEDHEYESIKQGAIYISLFAPFFDKTIVDKLNQYPIKAFSMDMIPRVTLAQSMDVLSSMASIAGYKAVLKGLEHLPRYMPMMITAAGSIKPARVLVLGAGVAGLQAIATARRLGAVVEAFDTRQAAKEEVESLGAKFVEVEGAKDDTAAGGYAVEQSEEFLKKQRALVQEKASKADIVITTAQVRGRKAPILLPKETVDKMRNGSVVVDLAASTGGNCELTKDGEVVIHGGVSIIGDSQLASFMPQDASKLYGNNVLNFLKLLIKDGAITIDLENEIIRESLITSKNSDG